MAAILERRKLLQTGNEVGRKPPLQGRSRFLSWLLARFLPLLTASRIILHGGVPHLEFPGERPDQIRPQQTKRGWNILCGKIESPTGTGSRESGGCAKNLPRAAGVAFLKLVDGFDDPG